MSRLVKAKSVKKIEEKIHQHYICSGLMTAIFDINNLIRDWSKFRRERDKILKMTIAELRFEYKKFNKQGNRDKDL